MNNTKIKARWKKNINLILEYYILREVSGEVILYVPASTRNVDRR